MAVGGGREGVVLEVRVVARAVRVEGPRLLEDLVDRGRGGVFGADVPHVHATLVGDLGTKFDYYLL